MLPAVASRFNAAINVMQSIASWHEQQTLKDHQKEQSFAPPILPQPSSSARARANEAVSALFSVHHTTPTELMFRMVERIGGWLNEKLTENADQPNETAEASFEKSLWREAALRLDYRAEAAAGELTITEANEKNFRQVARMILDMFEDDYLSSNRELKKELEDMIGFRLDGVSVLDILRAAADPRDEATAEKVEKALSNGLAGQPGSAASQRLERAAKGPQSVEQAIAEAAYRSPIDEVNEETLAEDQQAIEDARVQEKLEATLTAQESGSETAEESDPKDQGDEAFAGSLAVRAYGELAEALIDEDDEDRPRSSIAL